MSVQSFFFVTEYQESRILGVRMDVQKQSFKWPFLVHKIYIVRRKTSLDFATLIPSLCYACLHCMALPCTKLHCITVLPWIMWYCTRWSPNSTDLYFWSLSIVKYLMSTDKYKRQGNLLVLNRQFVLFHCCVDWYCNALYHRIWIYVQSSALNCCKGGGKR